MANADCGHTLPVEGYGKDDDGRTYCYGCAAVRNYRSAELNEPPAVTFYDAAGRVDQSRLIDAEFALASGEAESSSYSQSAVVPDKYSATLNRMPSWLRWALMLPAALVGAICVQVVYRLVFGAVPPDNTFDSVCLVMTNAFITTMAFIQVGAQVAPRQSIARILLCLLVTTFLVYGIVRFTVIAPPELPRWLVVLELASIALAVLICALGDLPRMKNLRQNS
jgi:hypothetical protein